MKDKGLLTLDGQRHGCWCPGDITSQSEAMLEDPC